MIQKAYSVKAYIVGNEWEWEFIRFLFTLPFQASLFLSPQRTHMHAHKTSFFPPLSHTRAAATPESSLFSLSRPHTLVVHAPHTVCHSVNCCFATHCSLPSRRAHTAPHGQQTTRVIPNPELHLHRLLPAVAAGDLLQTRHGRSWEKALFLLPDLTCPRRSPSPFFYSSFTCIASGPVSDDFDCLGAERCRVDTNRCSVPQGIFFFFL